MEILLVIAVVAVLGWALGIAGYFKARRALRELAALRVAMAGAAVAPPAAMVVPVPSMPVEAAPPVQRPPPVAAPRPATPPRKGAGPDIEALLTQRWGIWLGAAALLLAAVFLVRTAVEQEWVGPGGRCALAGLLGLALIGAAEWLRRRPSERTGLADLGPGALASGGVAAWFAGGYGAGPLYGLLSPTAGFVLLAGAGLAGLALSLRFGLMVGAIGLIGAFATPALVQGEPNAPGLFMYLTFISAAAWAVVRYTAWTWLGWGAAVAGAAWVLGYAAAQTTSDVWAPGLFVPASVALSLGLLPGAALEHRLGRRLAWVPMLLLGAAGVALAASVDAPMVRLGVLLLAPVAVGKGWAESRLAWLPFLSAALFLGVLLSWALPAWHAGGEPIMMDGAVAAVLPGAWLPGAITPLLETAAAMAAWFAAAGLWLERRTENPTPWAGLAALVPVATLAVTYAQVGQFQPPIWWAFAAPALAAALVAAASLARPQAHGIQRAGMHAAGAVAALSLASAIVLDRGWLTVAIGLLLPALARIEARADLPPLRRVALIAACVVLVRLVLNPYVLEYEVGAWPVVNGLLPAYGVPAVCFAVASAWFRRRRDDLLVSVLEAGACAFTAALVILEVHHWAAGGVLKTFDPAFLEGALQVSALGGLAVLLLWVARRNGRRVVEIASRIVGGLALAAGIWLVPTNPWAADQPVGRSLLLNALLPAYAVPAFLAAASLRLGARPRGIIAAYAGVAAFMWVTLEVRHAFHRGPLGWSGDTSAAELWAYSGTWMLLGIGLMGLGLWTGWRALRLAALGLLGLAAAKVFLVDMSGLEGLWRVLSFLGLGVSLIGLGAFYRRFVGVDADPTGRGAEQIRA